MNVLLPRHIYSIESTIIPCHNRRSVQNRRSLCEQPSQNTLNAIHQSSSNFRPALLVFPFALSGSYSRSVHLLNLPTSIARINLRLLRQLGTIHMLIVLLIPTLLPRQRTQTQAPTPALLHFACVHPHAAIVEWYNSLTWLRKSRRRRRAHAVGYGISTHV